MDTLFASIAQCAATVIAIIGGFIVTKLISFNAEKSEIIIRLDDIAKEKQFRSDRIAELENELKEDDALDLIHEGIEELMADEDGQQTYNERQYNYTWDEFRPYWEKARATVINLRNEYEAKKDDKYDMNGIPLPFAKALSSFEYEVCQMIMDKLKSHDSPLYSAINANRFSPVARLNEVRKTKMAHSDSLRLLELQEKQLTTRKASLEISKSTIAGLGIFGGFALTSIVFPIIILAIAHKLNEKTLTILAWINIPLFIIGLGLTIAYLVILMKSKKRKKA